MSVRTSTGQSSNLAVYQDLALECVDELPSGVDTLVVEGPDRMPYLRSALVSRWQEDGRAVFLADSSFEGSRFSYDIEEAAVTYSGSGRDVRRDVRLAMRYTLANNDGRLLLDDSCERTRSDVVPRAALQAIQHDAYPETQAEMPEAGWFRRYVEPAVLTVATAVVVYLFFTQRSRGTDGS